MPSCTFATQSEPVHVSPRSTSRLFPAANEEPVLFDTSEIPWWAWVRRFHLPEAEKLNGRAAMMGYVLALFVDQLTGGWPTPVVGQPQGLPSSCRPQVPFPVPSSSAVLTPCIGRPSRKPCQGRLCRPHALNPHPAPAPSPPQAWACWTSRTASSARCCCTSACLPSCSSAPPRTLTSTRTWWMRWVGREACNASF